ncbi:MAG: hypothetical protein ACTSUD_00250 [Alphaproteobacteria bacterium]
MSKAIDTAGARSTSASLPLAGIGTLFADAGVALDYARELGCPTDAEVLTTAPALAGREGVRILDGHLSPRQIRRSVGRHADLSHEIHGILTQETGWRDLALVVARAVRSYEVVVYKAMGVRAGDLDRPFAILDLDIPDMPWLTAPWATLFAGHPNLATALVVPPDHLPGNRGDDYANASLRTRLWFEDWQSIAYRLAATVLSRLPLAPRGSLLIRGENALIKETALRLMAKGFRPQFVPKRACPPEPLDASEANDLEKLLTPALRACYQALLDPQVLDYALAGALGMAREAVGRYRTAAPIWSAMLGPMTKKRPAAMLMNLDVSPETQSLIDLVRRAHVPVLAFQHGTGPEICRIHESLKLEDELSVCDRYCAFSEARVEIADASPFRTGSAVAVGQPRETARFARKRGRNLGLPPILYASSQAFMGYMHRPAAHGVSDRAAVEIENDIIEGVLGKLPHRVLYKPYPALRYLDPNPSLECAGRHPNLEIFETASDLRYLLADTRVVVTSLGHSTVSWCIASGAAVVFMEQPDKNPLRPEARKAFAEAMPYFNCGETGWQARMRDYLSRPIEDIERDYAQRAPARRAMVERFMGVGDGRAGSRAVAEVAAAIAAARTPA